MDSHEPRRGKRVVFTTPAPLATASGSGEVIENASTIDLSESGVRVRLRGQIEPGQVVELFLGRRPARCRVVWITPGEAAQERIAGLEFICPLPGNRGAEKPPSSNFEPIR